MTLPNNSMLMSDEAALTEVADKRMYESLSRVGTEKGMGMFGSGEVALKDLNPNVMDEFTALMDRAYHKFAKLRTMTHGNRMNRDSSYNKAFQTYAKLWKFQQDNRVKLVELGLKRWEVGEIASRIGQLYYNYYLQTSQLTFLLEAYVFYEAIASREYFKENMQGESALANKQMRYVTRFIVVSLLLNRRDMARKLLRQLRSLVEEYSINFQAPDSREWKLIVNEGIRFMKADGMAETNRNLRYNILLDPPPEALPPVISLKGKNSPPLLILQDAILTSYCFNEIKFGELTLDTYRMAQSLEWEPSSAFRKSRNSNTAQGGNTGNNAPIGMPTDLKSMRNGATELDEILLSNQQKQILYRPTVPQLLLVLSTSVDELLPDGALLFYISAAGITSHLETMENGLGPRFVPGEMGLEGGIVIGSKRDLRQGVGDGDIILHPQDIIPFTRRSLFIIVDSNNSRSFEVISGRERGEQAVLLLSPSVQPQETKTVGVRQASTPGGSLFTLFLTAPLLAFCRVVKISMGTVHATVYQSAEKQLCAALSSWGDSMAANPCLDYAWGRYLGEPMARLYILRFIFCRAVLSLNISSRYDSNFLPTCLPALPADMLPGSLQVSTVIRQLASMLGVADQFEDEIDSETYGSYTIETHQRGGSVKLNGSSLVSPESPTSSSGTVTVSASLTEAMDGFHARIQRPNDSGLLDSAEYRSAVFDSTSSFRDIDNYDHLREIQGGFVLTPAREFHVPPEDGFVVNGRSGNLKESNSSMDPHKRRFRMWPPRSSLTTSPLNMPTRVARHRSVWNNENGYISTLPEDGVLDEAFGGHDGASGDEADGNIQQQHIEQGKAGMKFMPKTAGLIMKMLRFGKTKKGVPPSVHMWPNGDYDSGDEEDPHGGDDSGEDVEYDSTVMELSHAGPKKKGWWRRTRREDKMWASADLVNDFEQRRFVEEENSRHYNR